MFKPEQREEFMKKIKEKAVEAEWIVKADAPYSHHLLFEVNH